MTNQLSGVAIIIFMAAGFTTFVLLFIFGKRQIMRFALKSRRGPHFPIAADAPRHLRKEIERRLDAVKEVRFEPRLLSPQEDDSLDRLLDSGSGLTAGVPDHVWRMKAVDGLKLLEQEIVRVTGEESRRRPAGQEVRFYLQRQARAPGPLEGVDPALLASFLDSYSHARHEAAPFGAVEYATHAATLKQLREFVQRRSTTTTTTGKRPPLSSGISGTTAGGKKKATDSVPDLKDVRGTRGSGGPSAALADSSAREEGGKAAAAGAGEATSLTRRNVIVTNEKAATGTARVVVASLSPADCLPLQQQSQSQSHLRRQSQQTSSSRDPDSRQQQQQGLQQQLPSSESAV